VRFALPAVVWTLGLLLSSSATAAASCPAAPLDPYSRAVLADSPSAYYRLDETSGTVLCDSSTSAANGTYESAGVSFGVPGALLNSADSGVEIGAPSAGIGDGGPGITGSHNFTLEGWFRSTGPAQTEMLVDMGTAATGAIAGLGVSNSGTGSNLRLDTYNGVVDWPTGATSLYDQQWHYLAVSYDATSGTVVGYLDGVNLGPKASPHRLNLGASNIRLGWWVDTFLNHPFTGDADEIAVYPSVLSPARIFAHLAASRPGAPGGAGLPSSSFVVTVPRITCAGPCKVILVKVKVLGPGQVTVEESLSAGTARAVAARRHVALIKASRVSVSKPGTAEAPVRLTAAGQKLLKSKHKLLVKLRVSFSPTKGKKASKITSLLLRG
jgi:hypothetical protein